MWCRTCRQDVPGMPALADGQYTCPRCAETLERSDTDHFAVSGETITSVAESPVFEEVSSPSRALPFYDSWGLEEALRHVRRVLGRSQGQPQISQRPQQSSKRFRLDAARSGLSHPHRNPTRKSAKAKRHLGSSGKRMIRLTGVAWLGLSAGTICLAWGGTLLIWSTIEKRPELWTIGIPIILAGQLSALFGLIAQIQNNRRYSRRNKETFAKAQGRVRDRSTGPSDLTAAGLSSSFYAHLTNGANPDLLLSDLKSQLDLLAMKIGQKSKRAA